MGQGIVGSIISFIKKALLEGNNPFIHNYGVNQLRPPGAVDESRFMALCIRCNRCLEVCPFSSIKRSGIGATLGTPYVFPETKACYLCMACCRLCPTGALNPDLVAPEKVGMGKARINTNICYSHIFLKYDKIPKSSVNSIAALCNTCYSVCPFPDKAIKLESNLYPVVLDGCVGCGICVERCPTRPKRAINVYPTGMGVKEEAGFYFRKSKKVHQRAQAKQDDSTSAGALKGEALIEQKMRIDGSEDKPDFDFPYEIPKTLEDWE